MKQTIARALDALSIINIKIFFAENIKRDPKASDTDIAEATKRTNVLNSERNYLIDEIDKELNELAAGKKQKLFGTNKIYGK